MRAAAVALSALLALAAGCGSGSRPSASAPATSAPPAPAVTLHVTLSAPSHTPKASVKWWYSIRATRGGKPVRARLTVQIVDPVGGLHPVLYANTKRKLVDWPFRGTFRDFVQWPGSSRGIPLTLRVTVVAGTERRTLRYRVTAR